MNNLYKFNINGVDIYVAAGSSESAARKINDKFYPAVTVAPEDATWCSHFIQ